MNELNWRLFPFIDTTFSNELPGRIDDNEDAFTAALRETKEETDYSSDDLNIFEEHVRTIKRKRKNGKHKKLTFWLAELKDSYKKPVLSHEHSGYLWLGKNEIYWVHDNSEFIEMINDFDDIIEQIYSELPSLPIQNFLSRIIISNA